MILVTKESNRLMTEKILEVDNLTTSFDTEEGTVRAVNNISFSIEEGETMGIVGESGSGKSVTALSVMRLIESNGSIENGTIHYRGSNLLEKTESEIQSIRGSEISMVFQDTLDSLNPVYTIGTQINRVIRKHRDMDNKEAREETIRLLEQVGIPNAEERIDDYPHQFSGGMRQRALIAMAISCNPSVLIADEPTTALDVTIEAQIFEVLDKIQHETGMSIIVITHDLGVVAGVCDFVNVMYGGEIVEKSKTDDIFGDPQHPYTRGLLRSIPRIGKEEDRLRGIEGNVPNPAALPSGCTFHPRCPHATDECRQHDPSLQEVKRNHRAACIHIDGYKSLHKEDKEIIINDRKKGESDD
ncbi:putative dipeptides/oligopeptides ABC transporter ATP-binding protein [Halococcus thailandensis JCM 13552]|uniref:Nickel import system ATP-binding protein NikD n=1 Tax=Halococcus thailandensis JCM 13552 TaxID=1227457 RepID=M0MS58_9EURY|nr:putative dipeptides/oligopeptides ABC transporter ATP-binding protein [Halococcus thailandensis JCM 13552]